MTRSRPTTIGIKIVHWIALPDGRVIRRMTGRRYTHAVISRAVYTERASTWDRERSGRWGAWGFCGSLPLAEKLAKRARAAYNPDEVSELDVRIVEVMT